MTPTVGPEVYRQVMAHHPTGVAVVTAFDGDRPAGMVVGTFSAVSMDPPLVSFMPRRSSATYARLATAASYCVNVIAADQLELCRTMAGQGPGKFDHVSWQTSRYGAPRLDDAVAHVHCRPVQEIEAGDHFIVLCAVDAMEITRPVSPLIFFQGGYGQFSAAPDVSSAEGQLRDDGWWRFSDFMY